MATQSKQEDRLALVNTQVRTLVSEPNYGKFEIEPLERGYGVTLGNALRRVLLSSIPGAAITSVRIDGVQSEFEPIPGVKEDTVHLPPQSQKCGDFELPAKTRAGNTRCASKCKVQGA
jgi:hypothetical protein